VPFIATSATNEKVTVAENGTLNQYAFRVCFIDSYQGTAAANYAYAEGIRKVGMIETLGNPYSQNICNFFTEQFEALGGTIVERIGIQDQDVEFRAQLTNFGTLGIDALFFPSGTYKVPALAANQAADLNLKFRFIYTDGVYDDTLLEVAGPNIEDAIMTNYLFGDDPAYDGFRDAYNAKHKEYSANIFVYLAYDAVELLKYAVEKSKSLDSVKIRDALENAKDVELFTDKHFSVDPATHNPLNKMVAIIGVKDGKFALIRNYYPGN
jgi:branched-chain amino acid transport system substrate-binding protein